jgi:hypothetical protein
MNSISRSFVVVLLIVPGALWAQGNNSPPVVIAPSSYGGGFGYAGGYEMSPATPAGSILEGLAQVVRAQGDYNLATSAAAVNWTTATRQSIQNEKDYVEAYFAIRAYNRQIREAEYARESQLTQNWLRFHPSMKPTRLTSSELDPVSGNINWPLLLLKDDLTSQRQAVQQAFSERHRMGVMNYNNYRAVQQITNRWFVELLDAIQELSPTEYIQAKKFIEALIYEASLPLG